MIMHQQKGSEVCVYRIGVSEQKEQELVVKIRRGEIFILALSLVAKIRN